MLPSWRDQKRNARRVVHDTFGEPAWYLASLGATPVPVTVRLHSSIQALGALARGEGYAEVDTITPRLIFMNDQITTRNNAFVILKDLGAFKLNNVLPPDDITTTVEVAPVPNDQAARQGWDKSQAWMGLQQPSIP